MRTLLAHIAVLICASCASLAMAQPVTDQPATNNSTNAIVNERPLSARILGGDDAQPGEYPSAVALVSPGFLPLDQRLFCGGTVVAERWILTVAHCVYDAFGEPMQADRILVVAGITDLALDTPEQEHAVVQIVIHPEYDNTLNLPPNDIALLELETPVSAPSATLFSGETNDYTGALGFIAGWGAIEYSDPNNAEYPTMLQDAVVPLITNELCNAPESYDGLISNRHLCAGYADGKVDACAGDSGGPLFIKVDGVQVQAGITSFGIGCGLPLFYGIYTNVSYFIPWLADYIPVPYQSPELAMSRDNQGLYSPYVDASNDEKSFKKSSGSLSLWFFLAAIFPRIWTAIRFIPRK